MKFSFLSFLAFLFFVTGYSQNDCIDAIIICGNSNYKNLSASGAGVQELSSNNSCNSMEHNSLWLELPIKTGGNLGFKLIPDNTSITVDFDFFIFGPNQDCSSLGHAIRCSTTNPAAAGSSNNHTGMNSSETDISEGPGPDGNNFVKWLNVQAGDKYYLVIDRPIGSSDFSIEWTGTAEFYDIPVIDPNLSLNQEKCDDDGIEDQSVVFDLTENNTALIANQAHVVLSFHESLNDAIVGDNPIVNPQNYSNKGNPQIIHFRMTNTETGCYNTGNFLIEVGDKPLFAGKPNNLFLCDIHGNGIREFHLSENTALIQNGFTATTVKYFASLEDAEKQTNPLSEIYQNEKAYQEQTIWARLDSVDPCFGSDITSFTIKVVPIPEIIYSIEIVDFNGEKNAIEIKMENLEEYEFSIDGENYSSDNKFEGLTPGVYLVHIKDKKNCGRLSEEVIVLDYPNFFTPNGDGFNDVWAIPYLSYKPGAKIRIFNRYGKLVGDSNRWNGNYNGKKLPADDYWFTLEIDNRVVRGHFSLIR